MVTACIHTHAQHSLIYIAYSYVYDNKDNSLYISSFATTVQLNLNLTAHACSKGTTQHVFHFTHMQACVCTQDW